jgi:hypothetical protein
MSFVHIMEILINYHPEFVEKVLLKASSTTGSEHKMHKQID